MENRQIIQFFANSSKGNRIWNPLRRYFKILENLLQEKTLSVVERSNHKNNPPRQYYLNQLAKGFGIELDYDSPLLENRLNTIYGAIYYNAEYFALPRFFCRLAETRKLNIQINEEILLDLMMLGDHVFAIKYPQIVVK